MVYLGVAIYSFYWVPTWDHISTARLVSSIVAWLGWVGLSYFRLHEKSTELHFLCATAFFFGCLVHYALAGFDVVKAGAGKLVGLLDLLVLCASLYCIWVWRINGDPMGEWRAAVGISLMQVCHLFESCSVRKLFIVVCPSGTGVCSRRHSLPLLVIVSVSRAPTCFLIRCLAIVGTAAQRPQYFFS